MNLLKCCAKDIELLINYNLYAKKGRGVFLETPDTMRNIAMGNKVEQIMIPLSDIHKAVLKEIKKLLVNLLGFSGPSVKCK